MILVCGATGDLGGRIVRRLVDDTQRVRALVRPTSDATELERLGVEIVRGDLRDPSSLTPALAGVDTVVTTANSMSRILSGDKDLTMAAVDVDGNRNLVRAAEEAGVRRFVFVSAAGLDQGLGLHAPLMSAKIATEKLLRESPMEAVMVRPDMFQEVWLAPLSGIEPAKGKALVYGKGETRQRYVASDDVAALVAHLVVASQVPSIVEFGGPEALTRNEVVAAFEEAEGKTLKTRHVPRAVLAVAGRLMSRPKPALASLMGMALHFDTHPSTWDDQPLREAGIDPRPATAYIKESVGALT
ncbi:MAG: SDR family oxidoreductase [Dermatophilaceae bacterium]|nr:SDR family oxidoreductase [Intrasporangiaceae bacterium]